MQGLGALYTVAGATHHQEISRALKLRVSQHLIYPYPSASSQAGNGGTFLSAYMHSVSTGTFVSIDAEIKQAKHGRARRVHQQIRGV